MLNTVFTISLPIKLARGSGSRRGGSKLPSWPGAY